MLIEANTRNICNLLFVACLLLCIAPPAQAYEAWNAEVTTKVNVRRSPGLEGKVISGLESGERVLVKDQHEQWYNVVFEEGTFGYRGWVYGKFLKRIPARPEPAVRQEAPMKRAETVVAVAAPVSAPKALQQTAPQVSTPGEGPGEMVESLRKEIRKTEVIRTSRSMPDGHGEGAKPEKVAGHPVQTLLRENRPAPERPRKSEIFASGVGTGVSNAHRAGITPIEFLLKISPLLLSCLALFVSRRAWKLANAFNK